MMRSLFAGVAGLRNNQMSMDVIGNNIANVNTVGFKRSSVTFQDILSQTTRAASRPQEGRGGTNPMQVGLGMQVASINTIFTGSSSQSTSKGTDLMLQGDGMFIVKNGTMPSYTRNGSFDLDTAGNFVNSDGLMVQGWSVDSTGKLDTTKDTTGIKLIVGQPIAAKATQGITFDKNLDVDYTGSFSDATVSALFSLTGAPADEKTVTFQLKPTDKVNEYSVAVSGGVSYTDSTPPMRIKVSPAGMITDVTGSITLNGATSALSATLAPAVPFVPVDATATGVSVDKLFTLPAGVTPTASDTLTYAVTPYVVKKDIYDSIGKKHTMQFEFENKGNNNWEYWTSVDGVYADSTGAVNLAVKPAAGSPLQFSPDGKFVSGDMSIKYSPIGADLMTLKTDFANTTQFASAMAINMTQDGYAAGTLTGFNIDQSGVVTGQFSNGINSQLAQLAVAVFNNPGGLTKAGSSLFTTSNNSGDPQIGVPNTGGRGTVIAGALEMSNVDLAEEFTKMIIAQRGFSANSKIITTSDEMLQELVNLKR